MKEKRLGRVMEHDISCYIIKSLLDFVSAAVLQKQV